MLEAGLVLTLGHDDDDAVLARAKKSRTAENIIAEIMKRRVSDINTYKSVAITIIMLLL